MIKIIVDCFGGDKSPKANIEGAIRALNTFSDLHIIFTGDEEIIKKELESYIYNKDRITIVHAPEVISCDEKPTDAVRYKKESSLVKGIRLLREEDDISALISAGSSGAVVTAAVLRIGRIEGIIRPAFCPIMPSLNGGIVGICDSGANIDCKADMLEQFGVMGSLYLKNVYNIENPKVALLNIGTEEDKGDDLHKEAYQLLKNNKCVNFVGNMESRDLLSGKFDLVVCDGFSGNVLIKSCEGTAMELLKKIKKDIFSKLKYKIGALFMKKMFNEEKEFMNYQNYGGSVLLGLEKVVIKAHGSANSTNIFKSIEIAYKIQMNDLNSKIKTSLQ